MKRMKSFKTCAAVMLTALMLGTTACGGEGGRNVEKQNAVEGALQSQIQKEEEKTGTKAVEAVTTETKTEVKTEGKTEAKSEVKAEATSEAKLTETETEAKAAEAKAEATTEKDIMDDIRGSDVETPDASVDIDLTAMSSDMVYATVYQMVLENPEDYVGKKIKMRGAYTTASSQKTDLTYHYVIISDATQCCSQGIEFVWGDGDHDASEYPEQGTEIEVIGVYETYTEKEDPDFVYSRAKDATMKVVGTGKDTAARAN